MIKQKHKRLLVTTTVFALFLLSLFALTIKPVDAQTTDYTTTSASAPMHVKVGVWLNNVEKVDLSGNSYRLDFYLWFKFDPSQISLDEVRHLNSSMAHQQRLKLTQTLHTRVSC